MKAMGSGRDTCLCIIVISMVFCILCMTGVASTVILDKESFRDFDVLLSTSYGLYDLHGDDYRIHEFNGFLTPEECDELIQFSMVKGLEPSHVYAADSDVVDTKTRVSEQVWVKDKESELVARISDRVSDITGYPISHQEDLQVVHYGIGGRFTPHYDPCVLSKDECVRMNGDAGGRVFTFLIYLNDDCKGGETVFPRANIRVKPEKGKAILFRNLNEDGNLIKKAEHGGEIVTEGEKWICNKWIRERPYV